MTLEKATKDMQALVAQHGFNYEGELTCDGRQIFTRRWTKKRRSCGTAKAKARWRLRSA